MSNPLILLLLLFATSAWSGYAPIAAFCPLGVSLVRPATGVSEKEVEYQRGRKPYADAALKKWLLKTNPGFGTDKLPVVRITEVTEWV